MKKEIIVLLVLLVFLVGCVEESPLTDEELKDLPSDDPALILSEEKALTGQGYSQLTSEKKQAFWNCWRSECQSLLKEAQQTTDYSTYRQCSLDCFDEAQTATDNIWCEDSDGIDYFTKGTVTSNIYTTGKEDECKTFSNGKTYLMEGKCVNDKYQYQQKSCGEVGNDYVCEEGICIEEESCNSIFLSEDNYNKSISLSYCDHLVTSNDMEIRFVNIDGELSLFALREFQGEKYILEYCDFNYDPIFPYMECNLFNIYADGLVVGVNSYDEFSVNLIVTNLCENDHPLCNQVGEDNISQYYSYDSGLFEYYLDPEIIPSEDIKDMYFEIRPQYDQDIFEFLEEYFEISPPVDRIGRIHYLDTSSGSGAPG